MFGIRVRPVGRPLWLQTPVFHTPNRRTVPSGGFRDDFSIISGFNRGVGKERQFQREEAVCRVLIIEKLRLVYPFAGGVAYDDKMRCPLRGQDGSSPGGRAWCRFAGGFHLQKTDVKSFIQL